MNGTAWKIMSYELKETFLEGEGEIWNFQIFHLGNDFFQDIFTSLRRLCVWVCVCVCVCVCVVSSFLGGWSLRIKWYPTAGNGISLEPDRNEKLRILGIFCRLLPRPLDTAGFLLPFVMGQPCKTYKLSKCQIQLVVCRLHLPAFTQPVEYLALSCLGGSVSVSCVGEAASQGGWKQAASSWTGWLGTGKESGSLQAGCRRQSRQLDWEPKRENPGGILGAKRLSGG